MQGKGINSYKYYAYQYSEKYIIEGSDELFSVCSYFGQDGKGFTTTLIFEILEG
jgi:hypothetical protein